jgi:fumarylacetoacetase
MPNISPPRSWLVTDSSTPFSLSNIPLGIASHPSLSGGPSLATRIGDHVLFLKPLLDGGAFSEHAAFDLGHREVFIASTLNAFAALGRAYHRAFRQYIQDILCQETPYPGLLKENAALQSKAIAPARECRMHLPMQIGDYTDFYVGLNHAHNVGVLFRGPQSALQPNYTHLPVGYHGRASTVRVSGTPVRRPWGQYLPQPGAHKPTFAPSRKLDVEIEFAAFVCKPNTNAASNAGKQGTYEARPVPVGEAAEHIFGYVLMNDWSARDVQAWEYVPLGPFNSKNFCTTISPWVVLPDALEPYRRQTSIVLPEGASNATLPYLQESDDGRGSHFDVRIKMTLQPSGSSRAAVISRTNSSYLLFSFSQMLAHHTITGCAMNVGDLLASGTISGPTTKEMGSLLEMTKNGSEPISVGSDEAKRTYLEDGDEVVITGVAGQENSFVGFGECRGVILPAIEDPLGR